MPEQTIHVVTPISREDLEIVISGLEVACGNSAIVITESWDLVVKDPRQADALNILFSTKENQIKNKIKEIKLKNQSPPKLKIRHVMRAWRILNNLGQVVEQISIEGKNRRLAAGEFDPDTILHHPISGRQRVTGPKGSSQSLVPS